LGYAVERGGAKGWNITPQQTQVHLRLSWGSVHSSYCSNIELAWPELFQFKYTCTEWLKDKDKVTTPPLALFRGYLI
jgi:hypothetical protein